MPYGYDSGYFDRSLSSVRRLYNQDPLLDIDSLISRKFSHESLFHDFSVALRQRNMINRERAARRRKRKAIVAALNEAEIQKKHQEILSKSKDESSPKKHQQITEYVQYRAHDGTIHSRKIISTNENGNTVTSVTEKIGDLERKTHKQVLNGQSQASTTYSTNTCEEEFEKRSKMGPFSKLHKDRLVKANIELASTDDQFEPVLQEDKKDALESENPNETDKKEEEERPMTAIPATITAASIADDSNTPPPVPKQAAFTDHVECDDLSSVSSSSLPRSMPDDWMVPIEEDDNNNK